MKLWVFPCFFQFLSKSSKMRILSTQTEKKVKFNLNGIRLHRFYRGGFHLDFSVGNVRKDCGPVFLHQPKKKNLRFRRWPRPLVLKMLLLFWRRNTNPLLSVWNEKTSPTKREVRKIIVSQMWWLGKGYVRVQWLEKRERRGISWKQRVFHCYLTLPDTIFR